MLHVGNARTALFDWLFARSTGGSCLLRIEDTDVARSTQASVEQILAAMHWLGLGYDEGPIYQTQRLDRYREVAEQMVAAGTAYYAYETREELDAVREAALAANADAADKIRAGNMKAIGAIIGHVMRETKGRADGGAVQALIREKLGL